MLNSNLIKESHMKTVKNIKIILVFIIGISTACTSNFEEINTDTTFPETATPALEFRGILWRLTNAITVDGWEIGNKLAQLTTNHDFNGYDRYDELVNSELWDKLNIVLRDINLMLQKGTQEEAYAVYEGPLLIIKAYTAGMLTDLWGDVPFTEAGRGGEGILTPRYDRQEDIYTADMGIIALLTNGADAAANYNGNFTINGDIIYDGDLELWKRLGNSLKLRYLLRVSTKISNVGTQMQTTIDNGVFNDNSENAKVDYLTIDPNRWYLADARSGDIGLTLMTTAVAQTLTDRNDPRIAVLFQPNSLGNFNGLESGVNEAWKEINGFNVSDFSNPNATRFLAPDTVDATIINYAEVNFIIAEAITRGLLSGDANTYYNRGIQANFEYLDINLPAAYLTQNTVDLNQVNDPIEAIVTQKWIANFGIGYEGYFNHRRTGYPNLSPSVGNINNDLFPVRFIYPETEQVLNRQYYEETILSQGDDSINTRMWLLE